MKGFNFSRATGSAIVSVALLAVGLLGGTLFEKLGANLAAIKAD